MSDDQGQPHPATSTETGDRTAQAGHRLDSWKEIAAHLKRDVRTVQLWEKNEGLPVHRHVHLGRASVYAYTNELQVWQASRDEGVRVPEQPKPPEETIPSASTAPSVPRLWPLWAALATIVAVLAGSFALYHYRHPHTLPAARSRLSVAVLPFRNLSGRGDNAWVATALSEIMNTELAAGEQLRIVSGENVARMKMDLALPDVDTLTPATLAKIHKYLQVDYVVLGSYIGLGGNQVRVDLRLQDAETGEIVTISQKGNLLQLDELVMSFDPELRSMLGAGEITTAEATAVRATSPSNPDAARLYWEGLAKLRTSDNLGARDLLEKAIAADPSFALAHSALADAWQGLGYDAKAKDEAKQAVDLSTKLSREDRLWVEGRYRETAQEWEKAVPIYQQLSDSFPDNVDYGLRLSNSQARARKEKEAIAALDRLRRLPAPARDDPRIDLAEGRAASLFGDFNREQAASVQAAWKGNALGARILMADALSQECHALLHLGQPQESAAACDAAQHIYGDAGDRNGVANVLLLRAMLLDHKGDYSAAKQTAERAYSLFSQLGDEKGRKSARGRALGDLGVISADQGRLEDSRRAFEQAMPLFRDVGDKESEANTVGNFSALLEAEGPLAPTARMQEQAVGIFRELASREPLQFWLTNLAITLYEEGNLGEANLHLRESIAMGRSGGDRSDLAYSLSTMGDLMRSEGNLSDARKAYEESLDIYTQLGAKDDVVSGQASLAGMAIEEGHPADAEAPLHNVIAAFQGEQQLDEELDARTKLVRALLAENKLIFAEREVSAAQPVAAKTAHHSSRLDFAIAAARVHAALGQDDQAKLELQSALAQAARMGFLERQFEARLALGQIEMKTGDAPAGRAHLVALEEDAEAKGFLLVARKAHAEARP